MSERRAPGIRAADLDAVTIDGVGTLLGLRDPIPRLAELLPDHPERAIRAAFETEAAYYTAHAAAGRVPETLAALSAGCAPVLNEALGSSLTPAEYVGVFQFEVLPGVRSALERLRSLGLALAVVANWDIGLHGHLREHRLRFYAVVTSGDVAASKPDPAPFVAALERLGVEPGRAVHVGDHPPHDEVGARAAGLRFVPAPLEEAVGAWR